MELKADLKWLSELDVIISAGKLFQSFVVLGKKLNLYVSHDAWSGINLKGWGGGVEGGWVRRV